MAASKIVQISDSMRRMRRRIYWLPFTFMLAPLILPLLQAQIRDSSTKGGADWPMYNRDLGGTRFSPLAQINAKNVSRLAAAWTYRVGKVKAEGITGGTEMTPIVVNGMMYLATNNKLVALEPATGKEACSYDLQNAQPTPRAAAILTGASN